MSRKLTPRSTLEGLKREAKRWLKALRENDSAARTRLARVVTPDPREPTLRDVQHALALEYGHDGWTSLKAAVVALTADGSRREVLAPLLASLMDATSRGDLNRVAELLDAEPELVGMRGELRGHSGLRSALHFAVGGSHASVVALLLSRGADPNVRDEGDNAMPLHFAAEKENLEMVRMLVEAGADPIGSGDYHELDVIGWATVFGTARADVVDYLLAHGAAHNISSAVATGATDAIRALVAARHADLDEPMDETNHRRRPLHLAIVKKQLDSLHALLELGADTEALDFAGLTPLDQAALVGEGAMADLLLAHGARLGLPAAIALDREVERLLAEHTGELAPGGRWETLIVRAAEQSSGRIVELLLRHGASANAHDHTGTAVDGARGYSALHAAAFRGNRDAVEVLLAHGASVTTRDSKYFGTPAGWANYANHPAIRDRILQGPIDFFDAVSFGLIAGLREIFDRDAGALNRPIGKLLPRTPEPHEWTKAWWTPLALAVVEGNSAAVRELLELGARPDVRDPDGRGLAEIAEALEQYEIVDLIRLSAAPNTDAHSVSGTLSVADDATAWSDSGAGGRDALVARFLTNACPDHHVRGGHSSFVALNLAEQILARHSEIGRANIFTAAVCGDVAHVSELLASNPDLARARGGPKGSAGGQSERFVVDASQAAHPKWEPLLYVCFARLNHPPTNDNAVTIARLLLDHGADPNAYFMAGDSRYSPLSGAIGEGEEARLPHPRRNELVRLLLARGATPYDGQVFYNINFAGRLLWFLEMIYEESVKRGRGADWAEPEWSMLDMGGYGCGARYTLSIAIQNNDLALAKWALEHGASANARPARDPRFSKTTLYEEAIERGASEIANLLAEHGAARGAVHLDPAHAFMTACMRLDVAAAREFLIADPSILQSPLALHRAAKLDRADVAAMVLDLGISPNVADAEHGRQRALHECAWNDAPHVAQLLIDHGAPVDVREENYGATPLGFAIHGQRVRMIDLLSRHSSDIWNVAFVGAVDRVRQLLAARPELANVSYPDDGTTPLMRLPGDENAALAIARLLLDHGAEPAAKNSDGLTAADLARQRGMHAVAELLERAST